MDATRTQSGSSSGVGTEKVTYEEGSYRQRAGVSADNQEARFRWNEAARAREEELRLEAERRRQLEETSQGNYRTRGKIDAETAKSNGTFLNNLDLFTPLFCFQRNYTNFTAQMNLEQLPLI